MPEENQPEQSSEVSNDYGTMYKEAHPGAVVDKAKAEHMAYAEAPHRDRAQAIRKIEQETVQAQHEAKENQAPSTQIYALGGAARELRNAARETIVAGETAVAVASYQYDESPEGRAKAEHQRLKAEVDEAQRRLDEAKQRQAGNNPQ